MFTFLCVCLTVEVDEWLSSANVDSLGVDDESDLPRTPSHGSIRTDSSGVSGEDAQN